VVEFRADYSVEVMEGTLESCSALCL